MLTRKQHELLMFINQRLAATGVAGLPLVLALSVAMLVLVGIVVLGIVMFRLPESFDLLDMRPPRIDVPRGDGS